MTAALKGVHPDEVASWRTAAVSSPANGDGEMRCITCGRENPTDARFCNSCGQTLLTAEPGQEAPQAGPPLPTSIASGRYEVKRLLGEGAKKRVYLAHDAKLDRDVAVALLKTEGIDETSLARMTLEARSMARLGDHPGVVTVYDIGEDEGSPYIVSQYMTGGTLSDLLDRSSDRRLAVEQARKIGVEVCQALEHAHSHGIIHRDLKPANVWLSGEGLAKLGDFGLAVSPDRSRLTQEGAILGTVAYMSPEQALGKVVDARSDLYSLGSLLYEMVTGRSPFVGDDAVSIISQHLNAKALPPSRFSPEVPQPLDALILRLLAKSPTDRPGSAGEITRLLKGISIEPQTPAPGVEIAASRPDSLADGIFVGRKQELERLTAGVEEVFAGRGRLFMLVGEPGIGKTRTAEQLATYARLRSAQVLVGRCHEGEGAPAYWPWVRIIRSYVENQHPAKLKAEMGPGASDIAQVVSEVREILPDLPPLPSMEAEQARFRLFDSITTFLKNAAKSEPLVLLLDDLHWADKSSLLLLQFVAHQIAASRLLVVGTYRDVEVQRGHALAEILASLRRERVYERILLRGLPEDDVRALLAALGGQEVPEAFAREIYRETEGNPFFIGEILQHLVEERIVYREGGRWMSKVRPEEMGLPESVREVMGRRLNRLSKECNDVLAVASVIGREFELRALAQVSRLSPDALEQVMEEAVDARVLTESPGSVGRYSFSHALIRETLYEELQTSRRLKLHRSIAEALEVLHAEDLEGHLSELSYHYLEAAEGGGDVEKALEYARRAAERADAQVAFEDAARHYERALHALELKKPVDDAEQCELLLAYGDTCWKVGEFDKAKDVSRQAARLAERLKAPEFLARAALGLGGLYWAFDANATDEELVGPLTRALDLQPPGDSEIRARLLARLTQALFWLETPERLLSLAHEAIEMSRRVGDPRTMARVLNATRFARLAPDGLEQRLAIHSESRRIARQGRDPMSELAVQAEAEEAGDLLEAGHIDIQSLQRKLDLVEGIAEKARLTWWRWWIKAFRSGCALAEGNPEEAERYTRFSWSMTSSGHAIPFGSSSSQSFALATEAFQLGQLSQNADVQLIFGAEITRVRREQGRIGELEAMHKATLARLPNFGAFRIAVAYIHSQTGQLEEAREEFGALARAGFSNVRRDVYWLSTLWQLTEACAVLEDPAGASELYDLLVPYADRFVVVIGMMGQGSVSRLLGLLAATLRRWDDAARHFEHALEMHGRMGARLWLAWTQYNYAHMLLTRGDPADRDRALSFLSEALATAHERGLKLLLERALALKMNAEGTASIDVKTSIDAVANSVETNRPDLRPHAAPNGTVTIMFSDMEGFSTMTERLGDREAHKVIQAHNRIVREQVKAHGGYEVELQGDGFLLAFASASRAIQCGVSIQRAFAEYSTAHSEQPIRVRIGLHTGEPIKDADRFFGKTVILAARIASEAEGGEIFVSSLVKELTSGVGEFVFDGGQEVELKGLAGPHDVYELLWDGRKPRRRPSASRPIASLAGNVFVREGDYWTIGYDGKSFRLRDMKGLHCIAHLLRHPGQEFHVADLAIIGEPGAGAPIPAGNVESTGAQVTSGLGDAGEILDPQARAQYKERLESLRAELEEAKSFNDTGRIATLQEEIDFISEELSAAYGLGGRAKKAADSGERMRKTVTSRIRKTLGRIEQEHRELGLHFQNAIRTGTFCSYSPEKPTNWQL